MSKQGTAVRDPAPRKSLIGRATLHPTGTTVTAMTLESSRALDGGAMLLRYRIQNEDIHAATGR